MKSISTDLLTKYILSEDKKSFLSQFNSLSTEYKYFWLVQKITSNDLNECDVKNVNELLGIENITEDVKFFKYKVLLNKMLLNKNDPQKLKSVIEELNLIENSFSCNFDYVNVSTVDNASALVNDNINSKISNEDIKSIQLETVLEEKYKLVAIDFISDIETDYLYKIDFKKLANHPLKSYKTVFDAMDYKLQFIPDIINILVTVHQKFKNNPEWEIQNYLTKLSIEQQYNFLKRIDFNFDLNFNYQLLVKYYKIELNFICDREKFTIELEKLSNFKNILLKINPLFINYLNDIYILILKYNYKLKIYNKDLFLEYLNNNQKIKKSNGQKNCLFNQNSNLYFKEEEKYFSMFMLQSNSIEDFKNFKSTLELSRMLAIAKLYKGISLTESESSVISDTVELWKNKKVLKVVKKYDLDKSNIKDKMTLKIKNIQKLEISIYQINTLEYLKNSGKKDYSDLNLEGFDKTELMKYTFNNDPFVLHEKEFNFEKIKNSKNGVFLLQFNGDDQVTKVVVRKGKLNLKCNPQTNREIQIIDEKGSICLESTFLHINDLIFEANKETGIITIPNNLNVKNQKVIMIHNAFADVADFETKPFTSDFSFNVLLNTENIVLNQESIFVIQPKLTINNIVESVSYLNEANIDINILGYNNEKTTINKTDIEFKEDRDLVIKILFSFLPKSIDFNIKTSLELNEEIIKINKNKLMNFSSTNSTQIITGYVNSNDKNQIIVTFLGENGEKMENINCICRIKFNHLVNESQFNLKSNSDGIICLDNADLITSISVDGEFPPIRYINDKENSFKYLQNYYISEDEELTLNISKNAKVNLFNLHNEMIYQNMIANLETKDNCIIIKKLKMDKYVLFIDNNVIKIEVVDKKLIFDKFILKDDNLIIKNKIPNPINLSVNVDKDINVKILNNDMKNIRMHVFGVNYETSFVEYLQSEIKSVETTPDEYLINKLDKNDNIYFDQVTENFELMYIKNRKEEKSYIGTTIEKPKLIINHSKTSKVINNNDPVLLGAPCADSYSHKMGYPMQSRCMRNNLEYCPIPLFSNKLVSFLKNKGTILTNILPDANNNINLPLENLKKFQKIFGVVTDGMNSRFVHLYHHQTSIELKDSRLEKSRELDLITEFNRKFINVLSGNSIKLPIQKSNIYIFDNISKLGKYLHSNLSEQSKNNLRDYNFLTAWSSLTTKQKLINYDKFRSHEINFFLYFKDKVFFNEVIKPFLVFKSKKSIIDLFMLEMYDELMKFAKFELIRLLSNVELLLISWVSILRNNDFYKVILNIFINNKHLTPILENDRNNVIDNILNLNNSTGISAGDSSLNCNSEMKLEEVQFDECEEQYMDRECEMVSQKKSRKCFGKSNIPSLIKKIEKTPVVNEFVEKEYQFNYNIDNYHLLTDTLNHLIEFKSMDKFLSESVFFSVNNEANYFFAISILDVSVENTEMELVVDNGNYVIDTSNNILITYKSQNDFKATYEDSAIICSQKIIDPNDLYIYDDKNPNIKIEKFVKDYIVRKVYSLKVVVTNTYSIEQTNTLVYEIPSGAIVLGETDSLISKSFISYPLQSQVFYINFYFPEEGVYNLYPATIVNSNKIICQSSRIDQIVVNKSKKTSESNTINDVINSGDFLQIINFIKVKNIYNPNIFDPYNLTMILKNKDYYLKIIETLKERFYYNDYIWSFGVYHQIYSVAIVFMLNRFNKNNFFELEIKNDILVATPIYLLKEYSPLINSRAHSFLESRNSTNNFELYVLSFLKYMIYSSSDKFEDTLCLINCFINQDKNNLAISVFQKLKSRIDPTQIISIQFDYLCAYIDFIEGKDNFKLSKSICEKYILYPVIYWRNLFIDMINQISEYEESSKIELNETAKESANDKGLNTPSMTASLKDSSIEIISQFIDKVTISYFKFDSEVIFSLDPFMNQSNNIKSSIMPFHVDNITLDLLSANQNYIHDIPFHLLNYNLFVVVQSHTSSYSQSFQFTYKPFNMLLQVNERLGIIKVISKTDKKPVSKVYVKCYIKDNSNQVSFYKDGYTDIRGSFDYISLNVNKLKTISKFSILIYSEVLGSKDLTCNPPVDYNEVKEGISELISSDWRNKQQDIVNDIKFKNANVYQNVI